MSFRPEKKLSLAGIDLANKTIDEIQNLFQKVLKSGMHGICFSAYQEGQNPGSVLTEEQVRQRMEIIAPYTKYFINSQKWSKEEDIEMFYFTSFDESWKVDTEGDVGAYWGLWDKEEKLKY